MIGKEWRSKWDEAKNARAETERQVKNATAHASGLEKILDVARLNFGDKEVTPEMIGKAWRSKWDEAKNARAETEHDSGQTFSRSFLFFQRPFGRNP